MVSGISTPASLKERGSASSPPSLPDERHLLIEPIGDQAERAAQMRRSERDASSFASNFFAMLPLHLTERD